MWKDVGGYEGVYQIDETGQVKRVDSGRVLKVAVGKNGYPVVSLWKNNKGQMKYIHRMLGEAFLPNDDPLNKTTINHIDGNKTNNDLSNLEWATPSENLKHAYDTGLKVVTEKVREASRRKAARDNVGNSYRSIPVIMIDEIGNEIQEFDSIKHAADEIGCHRMGVYRVLKGHAKTIKNKRFKYKEEL